MQNHDLSDFSESETLRLGTNSINVKMNKRSFGQVVNSNRSNLPSLNSVGSLAPYKCDQMTSPLSMDSLIKNTSNNWV